MKRLGSVVILITLSALMASLPASGQGLEEVTLNVTLTHGLAVGVEVSWGLDTHSHIKVGLALAPNLCEELPLGLWGRVVYLYTVNPENRLSFYGGAGWSGLVGFAGKEPHPMAFLEAPLGIRFSLDEKVSVLGELRMGSLWLFTLLGEEVPWLVRPLGISAGVGYSVQ